MTAIEKVLHTATDVKGEQYEIKHTKSVRNNLFTFFLRQYADMIDNNFANHSIPMVNKSSCIYITYGNTIAGTLIYNIDNEVAWMVFVSVAPEYQGRGLLEELNRIFEIAAKRAGARRTGCLISKQNNQLYQNMLELGYTVDFYRLGKTLV